MVATGKKPYSRSAFEKAAAKGAAQRPCQFRCTFPCGQFDATRLATRTMRTSCSCYHGQPITDSRATSVRSGSLRGKCARELRLCAGRRPLPLVSRARMLRCTPRSGCPFRLPSLRHIVHSASLGLSSPCHGLQRLRLDYEHSTSMKVQRMTSAARHRV